VCSPLSLVALGSTTQSFRVWIVRSHSSRPSSSRPSHKKTVGPCSFSQNRTIPLPAFGKKGGAATADSPCTCVAESDKLVTLWHYHVFIIIIKVLPNMSKLLQPVISNVYIIDSSIHTHIHPFIYLYIHGGRGSLVPDRGKLSTGNTPSRPAERGWHRPVTGHLCVT
jgi:hypothetical protein